VALGALALGPDWDKALAGLLMRTAHTVRTGKARVDEKVTEGMAAAGREAAERMLKEAGG